MRFQFLPALVLGTVMALGCAPTSPLVGTWSGTPKIAQSSNPMLGMAGAMLGGMKGPCTLTLKPDGTGFLKMPIAPERAIAWSEEDGKVILRPREEDKSASNQASAAGMGSTVATLSPDKQKLDLDLGILSIAFTKQPDAK